MEILKIPYQNLFISARWSTSFNVSPYILHTGTLLRGEHSGRCCSISCNSVMLQATNWRKHQQSAKNDAMVVILKSTWDYQYTLKLQGMLSYRGWLGRNIVCNRHSCSIPQPKIAWLSIKMCACWLDDQPAWMLTVLCTQALALGVNILVNFAVYPAFLLCSRLQIGKNITNQWRKMMLRQQY